MIDIKKNVLSKRSLSVWPRPSKIYVRDPRSIYWSAPTNFMLEISPIRYIYWRPAVIISVMDTTINQLNELRRQGIITEQAYADALGVINSRERAPIPAPSSFPHLFPLLCGVDVSYETPPFSTVLCVLP